MLKFIKKLCIKKNVNKFASSIINKNNYERFNKIQKEFKSRT